MYIVPSNSPPQAKFFILTILKPLHNPFKSERKIVLLIVEGGAKAPLGFAKEGPKFSKGGQAPPKGGRVKLCVTFVLHHSNLSQI